ncbi:MAG: hypothetical protein JJ890_19660, partial [Pseudomonadales bacterium]|nr:hypothetical protein [Pseudomonadales bacterium]
RKMYHYNEIVELFKKHEIFGEKGDPIYNQLKHFGDMRNRVHIENYHQNLEGHEAQVFSANRLEALEETLRSLWVKMANDYKRPW